jgi:hypothetical protein
MAAPMAVLQVALRARPRAGKVLVKANLVVEPSAAVGTAVLAAVVDPAVMLGGLSSQAKMSRMAAPMAAPMAVLQVVLMKRLWA